jgi:hypothetical protein
MILPGPALGNNPFAETNLSSSRGGFRKNWTREHPLGFQEKGATSDRKEGEFVGVDITFV